MRPRKFLIMKLAGMGDVLMATPAARSLKKTFPDASVTWLVGSSVSDALKRNPYVDEVHAIDDRLFFKGSVKEKAGVIRDLVREMRKERFDAGFVLHRDWKYGALLRLCGVSRLYGLKRGFASGILLTGSVSFDAPVHHIIHYIEAVKLAGAREDGLHMDFFIGDGVRKGASDRLAALGMKPGGLIGIAPGGARNVNEVMDSRRWPEENFKALTGLLARAGFRVAVFGSSGDRWFTENWALPDGVLDLIGKTTLEETAAFMENCSLIVANDSGPMHLAAAVGRPVVSVFGPTDPREKHPLTRGSFYFWKGQGLKCSPCYSHGSFPDCRTLECMRMVTVAEVFDKVRELAVFSGGGL